MAESTTVHPAIGITIALVFLCIVGIAVYFNVVVVPKKLANIHDGLIGPFFDGMDQGRYEQTFKALATEAGRNRHPLKEVIEAYQKRQKELGDRQSLDYSRASSPASEQQEGARYQLHYEIKYERGVENRVFHVAWTDQGYRLDEISRMGTSMDKLWSVPW